MYNGWMADLQLEKASNYPEAIDPTDSLCVKLAHLAVETHKCFFSDWCSMTRQNRE